MVLFKSEMILVGCIKQQKNEDQEKAKTKQWAFFFFLNNLTLEILLPLYLVITCSSYTVFTRAWINVNFGVAI